MSKITRLEADLSKSLDHASKLAGKLCRAEAEILGLKKKLFELEIKLKHAADDWKKEHLKAVEYEDLWEKQKAILCHPLSENPRKQLENPHVYDDAIKGTSDCKNGCGAWMGPYKSGAPEGIDQFGECPNAKKDE